MDRYTTITVMCYLVNSLLDAFDPLDLVVNVSVAVWNLLERMQSNLGKKESQRQEARGKRQETRDKRQETRDKRQEKRDKRQETRDKRQEARDKRQEARDKKKLSPNCNCDRLQTLYSFYTFSFIFVHFHSFPVVQ